MDFSLSDCNLCSAHGRVHADTQVAVGGSFSFACLPRHVPETFFRKRKPVKHQFFQTSMFLVAFWFWNALNAMQKPFRNRSRVTSFVKLNL